jgi:hypothetical protein
MTAMASNTRKMEVSVRTRLLILARELRRDYRSVLHSYAIERLLYRLSRSRYRERFLLRGSVLLAAWLGDTTRPGHLELLSREELEPTSLLNAFREIMSPAGDAIVFDVSTLRTGSFPTASAMVGICIDIEATLEKARIPMRIDLGSGDVVFPTPAEITYPTLLNEPAPRLRCYRRETVIAEMLERMVALCLELPTPSVVRDLYLLIRNFDFDGLALARAIYTTFRRRGTTVPTSLPAALAAWSTRHRNLQTQWRILRVTDPLLKDIDVIADSLTLIAAFVGPVLEAMAGAEFSLGDWQAAGPWRQIRTTCCHSGQSALPPTELNMIVRTADAANSRGSSERPALAKSRRSPSPGAR